MPSSTLTTLDIDRGPQILAICGTLSGLAIFCVLLRLFVRVKIIRQVGWDDYFILAAAATMLPEMIVIVSEVDYGAGRHAEYIYPVYNIVLGLHMNFITQPLCLISLCFTKVSVGLFLLRLTPSLPFRRFIVGMIIFTILAATGNMFTVFFQCTPLAFIWDSSVPGGTCIPSSNLKVAAFFNSTASLLTDVIFALLPVPMLWIVQLNWKIKISVTGVLSLGLFASASALVKMTYLSAYGSHGDFLWDSADITIWTTIEICTAMIAASIPTLKPLFKAILFGSSAKYEPNQHSGPRGHIMPSRTTTCAVFELQSQRSRNTVLVGAGNQFDNESEESILAHPDGIVKTTEVSISVS